jgi:hypothetical protein
MYKLKWLLRKKTKRAELAVVWCYRATCVREQDLWKYWLPDGWFSSDITSLLVTVASAISVNWRKNEALTLLYMVPWPSVLICSMETQGSETFLINTLTRISIDVADSSVLLCSSSGLWAFCQAYVLVTKIWRYDKLDPCCIIHILGLITPNFLPICHMNLLL